MKKLLLAALSLIAFQSVAFAHVEPCLVHPSGGNPVVYVGCDRVEKVWDLDAARALINELVYNGVCEIEHSWLPECSVRPNHGLWSVYIGDEFWQNFAGSDVLGAAAFAQQLRDYEFCN